MSKLLYNLFLIVYRVGITIVSIWNDKAKTWGTGRKDIFSKIALALGTSNGKQHTVWMHCASLGEFEQGRPLLDEIRKASPASKLIVTFFSPSGYEQRKDYKGADHVFYLPMDGHNNAKKFIDLINPSLVLWIKYEYWYYYLTELKSRNIPTLLISATFREDQRFFNKYGTFWLQMLHTFTHIFLQNSFSAKLLEGINISNNVTITGDTRFDNVKDIADHFIEVPHIGQFCNGRQTIVAGSTWEDDEAIFKHYIKTHPQRLLILAPHEVDHENLQDIKKMFPSSMFYSQLVENAESNSIPDASINVLIIDSIGLLSRLYKYCDVAYVGGGFGDNGLHNILEAAVYGKPVIFGPETDKNFEAEEMIEAGGAISIGNALQLEAAINELLDNKVILEMKGKAAYDYVQNSAGGTNKIMGYLKLHNLLATS